MKEVSVPLSPAQQKRFGAAMRKGRGFPFRITKGQIGQTPNTTVLLTDADASLFEKRRAVGKKGVQVEALPMSSGDSAFAGSGLASGLGVAYAVDPRFRGSVNRRAGKVASGVGRMLGFGVGADVAADVAADYITDPGFRGEVHGAVSKVGSKIGNALGFGIRPPPRTPPGLRGPRKGKGGSKKPMFDRMPGGPGAMPYFTPSVQYGSFSGAGPYLPHVGSGMYLPHEY